MPRRFPGQKRPSSPGCAPPRASAESAESGESGLGCEPSSGTGESGLGCEPSAESDEESEEASEQSGLGCEPSADSEEESEEASKISGLRAISEPPLQRLAAETIQLVTSLMYLETCSLHMGQGAVLKFAAQNVQTK